jgi:hypothetical protein
MDRRNRFANLGISIIPIHSQDDATSIKHALLARLALAPFRVLSVALLAGAFREWGREPLMVRDDGAALANLGGVALLLATQVASSFGFMCMRM